jgi:hypothetical protein
MNHDGRCRRVLSTALFAWLVWSLVGHVCVLPLPSHAAPGASHETDGDHHGDGDAVHAASCEGVRSTAPVTASPVVVVSSRAPLRVVPIVQLASLIRRSPSAPSPPLFLLHASLLI